MERGECVPLPVIKHEKSFRPRERERERARAQIGAIYLGSLSPPLPCFLHCWVCDRLRKAVDSNRVGEVAFPEH